MQLRQDGAHLLSPPARRCVGTTSGRPLGPWVAFMNTSCQLDGGRLTLHHSLPSASIGCQRAALELGVLMGFSMWPVSFCAPMGLSVLSGSFGVLMALACCP